MVWYYVVLTVVGRVLMQVGCKKFATTYPKARFSVRGPPIVPSNQGKLQCLRLIRPGLCATGGITLEETGSTQQQVVRSNNSFAPGKVLSSRLVLSRSSHQTDFPSSLLAKVKWLFEAAEGPLESLM